jgi:RNA polymerase sigma-70 factor, ECF subfamily
MKTAAFFVFCPGPPNGRNRERPFRELCFAGKLAKLRSNQMRKSDGGVRKRKRPQSMRAAEESQLIERAKTGDEAAFSHLVFPYLRRIYFVALKITRNREDAEDSSQQTFLKALAHIDQFRGGSQFSTWLTRIAMNEALMVRRKRRSEEERFTYELDVDKSAPPETSMQTVDCRHPEAVFAANEKQRVLRDAIENLGVKLRLSVYLLGLEERKCRDAAATLNVSQAALKTRFMRARLELRETLTARI